MDSASANPIIALDAPIKQDASGPAAAAEPTEPACVPPPAAERNSAVPSAPTKPLPPFDGVRGGLPAKHPFLRKAASKGTITSPTDQFMSPASQKIEAKRKHLMGGIKPKLLANALRESITPGSPAPSSPGGDNLSSM
ncbi:hypothetical protein HK405_004202 [Cladochytrium tenue]|nr:hypothetical protein HK405_004202 [Cladochytrium tenue]